MTVIVESDATQVETFRSALGGGGTVLDSLELLEAHLTSHNEYAVVLGTSVRTEAAGAFAEWARVHRPTLGVILVRTRIDSAVLADALRSGMREVVEARDLAGLGNAVRRAYAVSQAIAATVEQAGAAEEATPHGRLYTVFSNKGGVGKSLVATNLGVALADSGLTTCVVDLDVNSGDIAIMLQLTPSRSLADLGGLIGDVDPSSIEGMVTKHSERLSILAAPVTLEARDTISPAVVGEVLTILTTMFEAVVVDTSGTFDDFALHALDASDALILVGTLDIPALKSLKVAAGTLDLLNFPRDTWRVVLNRADSKVGLSESEFEETLGVPITVAFPTSRDVLAAVNRGEPIVRAQPGNPVSVGITDLASTLATAATPSARKELPEGARKDVPAPRRKFSLRKAQ